ncbi:MAG: YdeI/OmpD-associated family protein [Pseudomonadota bacterium]
MIRTDSFAKLEIASHEALWTWLAEHHGQDDSVWLVTWKKAVPERYVSREAVLDALIAHGWIDGVRRRLDEDRTMQLISPRRQQVWAETYRRRAARLIAEGRMAAPGLRAIEAAKAAGLWTAMEHVDALEVPEDLAAALGDAADRFGAMAPSYRRNVLRWIAGAKRAETRAKRIGILVAATAAGAKVPQF